MSDSCESMDCSLLGSFVHMGFSRKEYWNGLPFPALGIFPNQGLNLVASVLAGRFFTPRATREAQLGWAGMKPSRTTVLYWTSPPGGRRIHVSRWTAWKGYGMRGQEDLSADKRYHRPPTYPPHLHPRHRRTHSCSYRITWFAYSVPRPDRVLIA